MRRLFTCLLLGTASMLNAGPECAVFHNRDLEKGRAEIHAVQDDMSIEGEVRFEETAEGLKVHAKISGLPPGMHGFHIHEFGAMGNNGKDAGGHYNPKDVMHGYLPEDGLDAAHVGDMGNIEADANGNVDQVIILPGVNLAGSEFAVAGRGVIIHEKADDFGQPVGNAGSRLAGGAIVLIMN